MGTGDGRDRQMELADGRTLAYLDLGDPQGFPLVSCHGGLSSRLDVSPADAPAMAQGFRLISPDRPGIGASTRKPDRTLLDWPSDVAGLADHLGIERFAVMGWSLGGSYAAACAHALGGRIAAAALIASSIPADWDGMHDEVNRLDRTLLGLAQHAAPLDRAVFHLLRTTAHRAPKAFARSSGVTGDLAEQLPVAVAEGLTDTHGVLDDYAVFGSPWGFDPADITTPVHLWQGDADDLVPFHWAERLAAGIPGSQLTIVPGASHFLWYDHWDDILGAIRAEVG